MITAPDLALGKPASLLPRLREARRRTDEIFAILRPEALALRPIPVRHRFLFYLGHVEAFDWNLIGRQALDLPPFHPAWDRLFAFGIDPIDGRAPDDRVSDWPRPDAVLGYAAAIRERLDRALGGPGEAPGALADGTLMHAAIEHRLMHAETLAYMLSQVPPRGKDPARSRPGAAGRATTLRPAADLSRTARIPAGPATLGRARGPAPGLGMDGTFGWDNEFEEQVVDVGEFEIDAHNVTTRQYLEFMRCGGYEDRSLWSPEGWAWKEREGLSRPAFWRLVTGAWYWRGMFGDLRLPPHWPVYVSHEEASAYARWRGKALMTEAEWHRAALGTPEGPERAFPWGDGAPAVLRRASARPVPALRGNFDFGRWDPLPVGSHPAGRSAFGVEDLVGNGWEWTATPFRPFPGFAAFAFYPGYSADFFDGRHFVLKGGSMRTAAALLRRSFRNWFQPFHPVLFAAFRCVSR